jgi:hypothetical protein
MHIDFQFTRSIRHRCISGILLVIHLGFIGCQKMEKIPTPFQEENTPLPANFYLEKDSIQPIRRVVMIPVHAPQISLNAQTELDLAFQNKINATQLFEVVFLPRENLSRRFGIRSFDSAAPLPDTLFSYIQESVNADAVCFFDITAYHPFRPIRIGIRAKLIDLKSKKTLWAFDDIFDAGNTEVAASAVRYERKRLANKRPTGHPDSILISPSRFTVFALDSALLTLPENTIQHKF